MLPYSDPSLASDPICRPNAPDFTLWFDRLKKRPKASVESCIPYLSLEITDVHSQRTTPPTSAATKAVLLGYD